MVTGGDSYSGGRGFEKTENKRSRGLGWPLKIRITVWLASGFDSVALVQSNNNRDSLVW